MWLREIQISIGQTILGNWRRRRRKRRLSSGGGCSTGKRWEIDVNGIFALAIDPERFSSASVFGDIASRFVDGVKGSRRAPGVDEILVPGERSFRERERRLRDGIPVYRKTLTVIEEILDELELPRQYGF